MCHCYERSINRQNKGRKLNIYKIFRRRGIPLLSLKVRSSHRSLRPSTFLKRRLWRRCFSVNFLKFFKNIFFTELLRAIASEKSQKVSNGSISGNVLKVFTYTRINFPVDRCSMMIRECCICYKVLNKIQNFGGTNTFQKCI